MYVCVGLCMHVCRCRKCNPRTLNVILIPYPSNKDNIFLFLFYQSKLRPFSSVMKGEVRLLRTLHRLKNPMPCTWRENKVEEGKGGGSEVEEAKGNALQGECGGGENKVGKIR